MSGEDSSSVGESSRSSASSSSASSTLKSYMGGKPLASKSARAYTFFVHLSDPAWRPPRPSGDLADKVSFACGQVEKTLEGAWYPPGQAGKASEDSFVFRGYAEFINQATTACIRRWITSNGTDAVVSDFECSSVYLKDREMVVKSRIDQATRYSDPDDLVGSAAWQIGKQPSTSKPGERTDFEAIREVLRDHGPEEGIRLVAEQFPGQFVRYPSGITQLAQLVIPKVREAAEFVLRPWQQALFNILKGKPHPRHIYWIEDGLGNSGKSRLSTYLCREMGAVELDGRLQDAAFSYTGQKIVIFDLARAVEPATLRDLYIAAEKLKNGQIYSSKYQSRLKVFDVPHVVFFSNSPPPVGVWSIDRLQHITISQSVGFSASSAVLAPIDEEVEPEVSGADLFKAFLEAEKKKATEAKAAVQAKRARDAEEAAEREEDEAHAEDAAERAAQQKEEMEATKRRKMEAAAKR